MDKYRDLDSIREKVLIILRDHGLDPKNYGVVVTLSSEDFDSIAKNHPYQIHPEMISRSKTEDNGLQWFVQITRMMSKEEAKNILENLSTDSYTNMNDE